MKIDLYNLKMLQTKKEKKNEYNRLRYQRKKEEIKAKQRLGNTEVNKKNYIIKVQMV